MDIVSPGINRAPLGWAQRHGAVGRGRQHDVPGMKRGEIGPMGDADERRLRKLFAEQANHFLLGRFVERGGGLIHEQPIGFMQQSASEG